MYYAMLKQYSRMLSNLDAILGKAIRHAEAKKFDPSNFCTLRLAPDMFIFAKQVQVACDMSKSAAALWSGREAPRFEDNEKTMPELRERIHKTVAFLETFKADDFKHLKADTVLKLANPPGKGMHAEPTLYMRFTPNFFFHVSAAYMILRSNGVEIGKVDFTGNLPYLDA